MINIDNCNWIYYNYGQFVLVLKDFIFMLLEILFKISDIRLNKNIYLKEFFYGFIYWMN